ncbi:MAG: response regulator [Gemmataceae bacterium]|nr:response regulator [Gemmataceae bacterium]MCI0741347.1 response regulator [Gemmataceae bacterium]
MPCVLLVEDHPLNRKLFRDLLSFEFEVFEAASAEAAREIIAQHRPDLILMDVQLPGIDGVTYVRELKADPKTADIPVVAVSAHAMAHTIEEAMAAGCAAYVTKPVTDDPFVFLEKLQRIIQTSATA